MTPVEFTATVHKTSGTIEQHILKVPALIGRQLSPDGKKVRLVCTLAAKVRFQCALMPYGGGDFYIMLNNKNRKSAGLSEGSQTEVSLEIDDSEYGLEMPEELAEMLNQEPEINQLFHEKLTAGRRRSFIYWVSSARSADKKLERALVLIEKFKLHGAKLSGEQLLGN